MKTADFMVRDPFREPVEAKLSCSESAALRAILPNAADDQTVVFTTPSSSPKSVIDAKANRYCDGCGIQVWFSPSSARTKGMVRILCISCVAGALGLTLAQFNARILADLSRSVVRTLDSL